MFFILTLADLHKKSIAFAFLINIAMLSGAFAQEKLPLIIQVGNSRVAGAAETQIEVNKLASSTREIQNNYFETRKIVTELQTYNDLLSRQIKQQSSDIADLTESIKNVSLLERQILPLMVRMIETLSTFIAKDLPFLQEERSTRITTLRKMMDRSDVTVAEKFRRVIEAYEIETDYGRTIEAYNGMIVVNGTQREVHFLKIGRIALLAQSANTDLSAFWDLTQNKWSMIDKRKYKTEILNGLKIARKEIAPDLISIPIKITSGSNNE